LGLSVGRKIVRVRGMDQDRELGPKDHARADQGGELGRLRGGPAENARDVTCPTPASASSIWSSVTIVGAMFEVARRIENPYRARSAPTDAAADTHFSKDGVWLEPTAGSRVSRKITPVDLRVDSSWRIMSWLDRATLGQWMRRRSSPSWYWRIV
jgi:hypothetical protein